MRVRFKVKLYYRMTCAFSLYERLATPLLCCFCGLFCKFVGECKKKLHVKFQKKKNGRKW